MKLEVDSIMKAHSCSLNPQVQRLHCDGCIVCVVFYPNLDIIVFCKLNGTRE